MDKLHSIKVSLIPLAFRSRHSLNAFADVELVILNLAFKCSYFFIHRAINSENEKANHVKNLLTGEYGAVPDTARDYKVKISLIDETKMIQFPFLALEAENTKLYAQRALILSLSLSRKTPRGLLPCRKEIIESFEKIPRDVVESQFVIGSCLFFTHDMLKHLNDNEF